MKKIYNLKMKYKSKIIKRLNVKNSYNLKINKMVIPISMIPFEEWTV